MSINFDSQPASRIDIHEANRHQQEHAQQATTQNEEEAFWGNDGFGFDDLIDLVNPLQHIPIVSSIYREITGDEIAPGPRMIGGAVVGGVTGFLASAANVIMENETGRDIGETVFSWFDGDEPAQTNQLAQAPRTGDTQPKQHLEVTLASARTTSNQEQERANGNPIELLEPRDEALEPLDFGAVLNPAAPSHLPDELPEHQSAAAAALLNDIAQQHRQAQWQQHASVISEQMKADG